MRIWKFQRMQTGLETQLKFYIDNCSIKQESVSVNVIEDNCYASGLSVKKISTDKIQPRSSRFSFVAFLTQDSQMQESSMLQCNVNLCVVADNNCVINTVDSQCPNEINYKYTVNGSNWKFWSFFISKNKFHKLLLCELSFYGAYMSSESSFEPTESWSKNLVKTEI